MPGVVNQKATSTPCTAMEVEPPSLTSPSRMKTPERPSTPRAMSPNKTKHYAVSSIPSLYVFNISADDESINTVEKIIKRFGALGNVTDAYFVVSSQKAPREDLAAIVKFSSWTDTERAFNAMNSMESKLDISWCVKYARPRTNGEGFQSISPRRLFVGQVPPGIEEEHIRSHFEQFGTLVDVSVLKSKDIDSPGCAFIEYDTWAACDAAIEASNGKIVLTSVEDAPDQTQSCRSLVVKYATSKGSSPRCHITAHATSNPENMTSNGIDSYWQPHGHQFIPIMFHEPQMYPHGGYFIAPNMGYFHPIIPPARSSMSSEIASTDTDSRKIFVGQLPRNIGESDLMSTFGRFGAIESAVILRNISGNSQGCGFVTYLAREHAVNAVKEMHGIPYSPNKKKSMVVRFASRRQCSTKETQ